MGSVNEEPILTPQLINAYYESTNTDLSMISNPKFRHFRFRLSDGMFYKVPNRIRVWADLKKQILNTLPTDIYYSTSCWLNPHRLGSRSGKEILENVIISSDLAFDIDVDGKYIRNFEEARKQLVGLREFIGSKNIIPRYSAFSGSKGFHLVCDDPWRLENEEENPTKREMEAIQKRKQIVQDAKNQGLFFDEKVTIDTRRIIRLPGTINSKTGLLCTVLSDSQTRLNVEKIFKIVTSNSIIAPRIPKSYWEYDCSFHATKSLRAKGRLGVRPTLQNEKYFSTFITNNIPGTLLKIPILEFGKWKSKKEIIRTLKDLQRNYGIGTVFLFEDYNKYVAFSLKAVSRRRLEKILFNAGSLNLNACRKYGCTYFRVGKSLDTKGKIVHLAPAFVGLLEGALRGQTSKPHSEWLSSLGIKVDMLLEKCCGPSVEKLELIHGIIE